MYILLLTKSKQNNSQNNLIKIKLSNHTVKLTQIQTNSLLKQRIVAPLGYCYQQVRRTSLSGCEAQNNYFRLIGQATSSHPVIKSRRVMNVGYENQNTLPPPASANPGNRNTHPPPESANPGNWSTHPTPTANQGGITVQTVEEEDKGIGFDDNDNV